MADDHIRNGYWHQGTKNSYKVFSSKIGIIFLRFGAAYCSHMSKKNNRFRSDCIKQFWRCQCETYMNVICYQSFSMVVESRILMFITICWKKTYHCSNVLGRRAFFQRDKDSKYYIKSNSFCKNNRKKYSIDLTCRWIGHLYSVLKQILEL